MNITIIAYRPNHEDYCMSCRMGSSDSELEISYFNYAGDADKLIEDMADKLAGYMYQDKLEDPCYAPYEITIIADGKEIEQPSPFVVIRDKALVLGETFANVILIHEKNEKLERERTKADEHEAAAKLNRRTEYTKLQQEFGGEHE